MSASRLRPGKVSKQQQPVSSSNHEQQTYAKTPEQHLASSWMQLQNTPCMDHAVCGDAVAGFWVKDGHAASLAASLCLVCRAVSTA